MNACDVLVVEDDEATRESVVETLRDEGLHVESAQDGAVGLVKAHALRPRVILLDMMLPRLNGWEFLSAVAGDRTIAGIPIVQTSAYLTGPTWQVAAAIRKPLERQQLLNVIHKYMSAADSGSPR